MRKLSFTQAVGGICMKRDFTRRIVSFKFFSSGKSVSIFKRSELTTSYRDFQMEKKDAALSTRRVKFRGQNADHGLQNGERVVVEIIGSHEVGMLASINDNVAIGMISWYEFKKMHESLDTNNKRIIVGDTHEAYIGRVHDDGKIDILARPAIADRIRETKEVIIELLRVHCGGRLPIGDKSSANDINSYIIGASKSDFKKAVGSLYKEGIVIVSPYEVTLREGGDDGSLVSLVQPPGRCTLYLSNLHKDASVESVREFVVQVLMEAGTVNFTGVVGSLTVADVRLVLERRSINDAAAVSDVTASTSAENGLAPHRRNMGYGFVDIRVTDERASQDKGLSPVSLVPADSIIAMSVPLMNGKIFKGKRVTVASATPKSNITNAHSEGMFVPH